jgi:hypothetical protein
MSLQPVHENSQVDQDEDILLEIQFPRQDGVAVLSGANTQVIIHSNNPTARATARKDINRLCKKPFRRAVAWCLYFHADDDPMSVEDLFQWLDEIGAASPYGNGQEWNDYHRDHTTESEKMVSDLRTLLRKHHLPCN